MTATVISSRGADADVKQDFYEIFVDPPAAFASCERGELSDVLDQIVNQYSFNFDLLCIPKWYVLNDTQKDKVLLIPHNIGATTSPAVLRYDMKDALMQLLDDCSETTLTCIEKEDYSFEKQAFEYQGFEELTFFDNEFYDLQEFLATLLDADIESVIRTQIVKLVQISLTDSGYDPNGIDGSVGTGTTNALAQFFSDLPESKRNDNGQFPNDVIMSNLFPNLLKYQPIQQAPSMNPPENGPSVNNEVNSDISAVVTSTMIENETGVPLKDSVKPGEITNAQEPTEQADRILKLESENDQFELEVLSLKKQLKDEQELYVNLTAENERLTQQLVNLMQQPISQLWDSSTQGMMTFIGEMPNNQKVELNVLESGFDHRACLLELNKSINDQYMEQLTRHRCFKVILEAYDEDENIGRNRSYDSENKVLIIPILEKQSNFISSVISTELDGFSENDTYSCYIKLELVSSQKGADKAAEKVQALDLYMETSNEAAILSDGGTLDPNIFEWKDRYFILADNKPDEINENTCLVTSDDLIPIVKEDDDPKNLAPIAIISRSGAVTLKNLPLAKKKAPEFHIFLDTLVGLEGDQNYGFNGAINNLEDRETQKVYFEGFLKGIQSYLSNNPDIVKVTLYQTVMLDNKKTLEDIGSFLIEDVTSEEKLITDEFIAEYMEKFNPGIAGEFDNKKRKLSELLASNGNNRFVAFGSSGLDADDVCQGKKPRRDYNDNALIFDVVPSYTIDRLAENKELELISQARGFAFKCKNKSKIIPLKPLSTKVVEEVADIVAMQLQEVR